MSAATEDKTEVVPDWATGYTMAIPCDWKIPTKCDREAEWFGNQHGCYRANICDYHMQKCYQSVKDKIAEHGAVECRRCKGLFVVFSTFIKAVRI